MNNQIRPQISKNSIPGTVQEITDYLWSDGCEAFVVGGSVRALVRREQSHDFDIATSAPAKHVLDLFPKAIPTGLVHGTVMIPTPIGPVDVTSYRTGCCIEEDLGYRDFTINAIAIDPRNGTFIDPHGGLKDLEQSVLRAPGNATDRINEDPLRALRAARFAATLNVVPDADLSKALGTACAGLTNIPSERKRYELERLLCGPYAAKGIRLLQETGLEESLVGTTSADTARVIENLPPDLVLRLAAWLRGVPVETVLRRLRFPQATIRKVACIVRHHPLVRGDTTPHMMDVRRIVSQIGTSSVEALLLLRQAELEADGDAMMDGESLRGLTSWQTCVRLLRSSRAPLNRSELALSGRDVMDSLNCKPGRRVGAALRFLMECVIKDPTCNEKSKLQVLLSHWAGQQKEQGT